MGYKLATGEVAPSQLRQAREIYGNDEGKVYGALLSQEAGTSLEGSGGGGSRVEGQRSTAKRKRRRYGHHKVGTKTPRTDNPPVCASISSISSTNTEPAAYGTSLPIETSSHFIQSKGEYTEEVNDSSSLKMLASAYSGSSSGESSEEGDSRLSIPDSRLPVPDSIQQMFHEPNKALIRGKSEATFSHSAHDNDSESDDDPNDLCYFEPAVSDDSDDNTQQHEPSKEPSPPSHSREWDSDKSKWVFSPSPLSSYVCWKCSKVGHLPKDCTAAVKEGSRRKGHKEGLRIPDELKSLYAKCRELQKRKRDQCAECGVHSNLACCLECGAVYCDGRGHLSSHLLSHSSHHLIYSYKLSRMLKCCKATCPVVNIYDLLVCSHCLSKAFSQHYSMINATWSQSGLRAIPNALCCEDHFDWHRANCPSVGEEHFITVAGLSHSGGSVKQLISEFFF